MQSIYHTSHSAAQDKPTTRNRSSSLLIKETWPVEDQQADSFSEVIKQQIMCETEFCQANAGGGNKTHVVDHSKHTWTPAVHRGAWLESFLKSF